MRNSILSLGLLAGFIAAGALRADEPLFEPPPLAGARRTQAVWGQGQPASAQAASAAESPSDLPAPPTRVLPGPSGVEESRDAPRLLSDPVEPLPVDPGYAPGETWLEDAMGSEASPAPVLPGVCSPSGACAADACCCDACCPTCGPFRLFDVPALRHRGIEVGGWIDQGITTNGRNPLNRFNGPVTFNDRSNEYQMNQLYAYAERVAETRGCGWAVGGRVDVLYGTDHRFAVADGLEDKWNGGQRFYGLALPQAYLDVAVDDLTVRMGHFYTIVGYESVMAPENFFYSHSYTMQYGEPFTHTGVLAMLALTDDFTIGGGVHRGWNRWEDNNDNLGFLGGLTWNCRWTGTTLGLSATISNEDRAGENERVMYSAVITQKIARRLTYVFQHDFGYENRAEAWAGVQDAEWYGFVNYLHFELNPRWSFGARYEWFSDDDGVRVAGLGEPKGIVLNAVPGRWQEVTVGLNYKLHENVTWRSECRWDWVDPLVPVSDGPFNDYQKRSQFLWGNDLIVRF